MISTSFLTDLVGLCCAFAAIFITYFKWSYTYWKRKNVPYLEPSIPFGNIENPAAAKTQIGVIVKKLYEQLKQKKVPHGGVYFFANPNWMPIDLDYVKLILAKDFHYFVDRGIYVNEEDDPMGAHLFAIGGQKWKNLRVKLSPTFTSGKMKQMFQTLIDCEVNLQEKVQDLCEKKQPLDIKELLACFTTDVIGSCAFGLECNSFKEENSSFRFYGKKSFQPTLFKKIQIAFIMTWPKLAKALKMRQVDKDVSDFFSKVVEDTVKYRETNQVTRNDFLQLLIDLKNKKEEYKHDGTSLTIDEMAAQSFIFFLAGFETSSTTMTFCLYELAQNQDIQQKVRDEINTVLAKYDGKVTYEALQEMKYMSQVLDETLRKYPPVPFITRQNSEDYKLPDEDVIIDKGTRVLISILGIHHDEEYYPDPEKFDPERFNEENSRNRHPYAHIPFGEGPRICIGLRFGLMQSKVGLTSLLSKYKFTLNEKTKTPLEFQIKAFILSAQGDVWLNAEKIQ